MAAILSTAYSWVAAAATPVWTLARTHPIAASLATLAFTLTTVKLVRYSLLTALPSGWFLLFLFDGLAFQPY